MPARRWFWALLVSLVAISGAAMTGCASSHVAEPDAAGDDDDDGGDAADPPTDAATDAQDIDAIDAPVCSGSPCSILDQCGCESTPLTPVCDLDFTMLTVGTTKCRSRNTTVPGDETTTCTMVTTCAAGHVCVGGHCRKYCDDDDDCAGPGGLCIIDLTQGNPPMPIPGAPVTCTTDCTPTAASNATCPATWACHIFLDDPTAGSPGDERYLTDCLAPPASGGGTGTACTSSNQCAAGLDCVTIPAGQQCRPTCNMATQACPGGSGSCRGFDPPVVIGAATYGVCF